MNRIALAFLTKDKVDLSVQSIEPLLDIPGVDSWWIDGSDTVAGQKLPLMYPVVRAVRSNIRGGPDAAVCYALTEMLAQSWDGKGNGVGYDYVGIVENDVLLDPNWFPDTFSLFERARDFGLEAGMVSARAYEDRVLAQVDDTFALMHNLGYGMFIATRQAAQLWLRHFRTCQAIENRRMFAQLAGVDIASFWAFGAQQCGLVSDWHVGTVLAAHGLACLALTPARCRMIGQDPPLDEQGLVLATGPVHHDIMYGPEPIVRRFGIRTARIRACVEMLDGRQVAGTWRPGGAPLHQPQADGTTVIFAHQLAGLGAEWSDSWRLARGPGPFSWRAAEPEATLQVELCGPIVFLLSGPGRAAITQAGYETKPDLPEGDIASVLLPAAVSCRPVMLTALDAGVTVHGIVVREPQPSIPGWSFDWNALPAAGGEE
ncbi:MAG: hypothetical protein ABSH36_11860 [Solirubrobacteraceae bacterium]